MSEQVLSRASLVEQFREAAAKCRDNATHAKDYGHGSKLLGEAVAFDLAADDLEAEQSQVEVLEAENARLKAERERLREFCQARFNIANDGITLNADAFRAGEREAFRCLLAAIPTDEPAKPDAHSVADQKLCRCGHTAHWHSFDGWGDCEHSQDCHCEGFSFMEVKDV